MTRLRSVWLPVLLQTALVLAACDDSDDDDDGMAQDAGRDSGADATVPRDAATATDGGGDASTAGLQCKTPAATKCGPFSSPFGQAPEPCCYSGPLADGTTADSVCSGRYMGTCLPPAVPDSRCDNISAFNMTLQGCCSLSRRCGVNSNQTGLGCPDLETTEAAIKMVNPSFTIPAASKRPCALDAGTTSRVSVGLDAGL